MAEIATAVGVVTAEVLIVNVADEEPEFTVTLAGTVATEVLLLVSVAVPPDVLLRAKVPVDE